MLIPLEIVIITAVLSLLSLLDRLLKVLSGKSSYQHFRSKIKKNKEKLESIKEASLRDASLREPSLKDDYLFKDISEIQEIADELIDLTEELTFLYSS